MRRRAAVVTLVTGLAALAACGGDDAHELTGYTRDPAPQVDGVALPDVSRDGEPFAFRATEQGVLLVYFGYTNCPDICPTTMADVRGARRELGDDAERVDLAMVTVDPDRDAEILTDYVQSFVDDAHALATDDPAALLQAAEPFGVSYEVATTPSGEIEVGHSGYLFAVDDAGTLVLTWPVGVAKDDLLADLEVLLDQAAT
jgi:protein SCO1/2